MHHDTKLMLASLLACGVDPAKSTLFRQSDVLEHAQLGWIMGCLTTMPRISAFPQYKEKSASMKEIPLGLFTYPVLQSADILLYKATEVPVGEDQVQHIQLAQHLANRFNNKFGNVFPYPKAILSDSDAAARIKSLRAVDKKMSKSEPDAKGRLEIIDTRDVLLEKCKKAITDFTSEVSYDPEKRPGVSNLISIHGLLTGKSNEEVVHESSGLTTAQYKLVVAEVVNEKLAPIRNEITRLLDDKHHLDSVFKLGKEKAQATAATTMEEVRKAIGFS